MVASVIAEGSQTTVITTEHTLATITAAGVYQCALDLSALADGTTPDILTVRVYGAARPGGTERLAEVWEYIGSQGKPLVRTNPEVAPVSNYRVTIQQSQGSPRAIPWAVYGV